MFFLPSFPVNQRPLQYSLISHSTRQRVVLTRQYHRSTRQRENAFEPKHDACWQLIFLAKSTKFELPPPLSWREPSLYVHVNEVNLIRSPIDAKQHH